MKALTNVDKNSTSSSCDKPTHGVDSNRNETVAKDEYVTVKGNQDLKVDKSQTETIKKNRSLKVKKNNKEHVSRNKSVTVNVAYATQVGAMMNTAVGLLQAEEVGLMKKTMVGKSYSITVGDKFEISVGDSKLTMTPDGIVIAGKTISIGAESSNTIIGNPVAINPGAGSASGGGGGFGIPSGGAGSAASAKGFGGAGKDVKEKGAIGAIKPHSLPPLAPSGFTGVEETQILSALKEQRLQLQTKYDALNKRDAKVQQDFAQAYGTPPNLKAQSLRKIKTQKMIEKTLKLNKEISNGDTFKYFTKTTNNNYAQVLPTDPNHIIKIGITFWGTASTGKDTRGGVLSHEMSHFVDVGGTLDKFPQKVIGGRLIDPGYLNGAKIYGPTKSAALRDTSLYKVLKHADSFEYYLENETIK